MCKISTQFSELKFSHSTSMSMMVPAARASAPFVLTPELIQEAYKDLKWTGRRIGKAYKKRKRNYTARKRRTTPTSIGDPSSRIGSDLGSSNAKRVHTYSAGALAFTDNTLFQHTLALPQEGTTPAQRQRNLINLRGFKLCLELNFDATVSVTSASELYVNVAVVVDKRDPQASSISDSRFFRDSTGTDRGIDFSAVPDSLGLHCLPLNSDQLLVFMRKKFRIRPNPQDGTNLALVDQYLPINRQIRFTETNTPDTRFHLMYWVARAGTTGVTPVTRGTVQYRHITYFKETCDC